MTDGPVLLNCRASVLPPACASGLAGCGELRPERWCGNAVVSEIKKAGEYAIAIKGDVGNATDIVSMFAAVDGISAV